jgi:regulator of protease activity HflC (stomatin/prohibitin superfamily)
VLAVALLLTMFGLGIIGILMVLAATFYAALQAIALVRARGQVLRSGEVDIWSGWGKLVSWNPNEGVVFLRNKEFAFFTQGGGTSGGIQVVLPFMGEELAFRTSIETRQVFYEDAKVFTKEMIPLLVRANIYWRVSNVGRFYLGVGRDVRSVRDSGGSNPLAGDKEGAARSWLCAIAEEETRRVIARVGAGLLISDQLMDDMMLIGRPDIAEWSQQLGGGRGYRGVTDVIVEEIERAYNERLNCYGVHVERVALQEMSAPPEIYGAAQAALKASFDPAIARARAMARRIELENEAELIGKDALALKEIAGNLPALAFQDMLGPLFSRFGQRRGAGI